MKLKSCVLMLAAVAILVAIGVCAIDPECQTVKILRSDGDTEVMSVDSAGQRHGECMKYSPCGIVRSRSFFHHGVVLEFAHYADDGRVIARSVEGPGYSMVSRDY